MKKLGFGLMRLPVLDEKDPSTIDMDKLEKMVDVFLERGYTYFDTAYMYHGGKSESAVKDALVKRYPRDKFFLTSKLPPFFMKKAEDKERIFEEQIARCGTEYFDNYLLHSLNEENYALAEKFGCFEYTAKLKSEGRVKCVGFSFHDTATVLDKILTEHPEMEFVQLQLNYLDWEDDGVQSRKCYETAVKHGKKVIVMEPVKGGALANLPEEAVRIMHECHPDWSPASWALRFVAGLENVMMVLSGMSTMEQLLDNTSFMDCALPLGERERSVISAVTSILRGKEGIACTACRYCTDGCPKHIAIPQYFALYNNAISKTETAKERTAYAKLTQSFSPAKDCIACRKCEKVCPQHLKISEHLKKVSQFFDI